MERNLLKEAEKPENKDVGWSKFEHANLFVAFFILKN